MVSNAQTKNEKPLSALSASEFDKLLLRSATQPEKKAVAVAVSGGPDSMALCFLLSRWAEKNGGALDIHAVTIDHGLRAEAAEEAALVGHWLKDIPHVRHHVIGGDGSLNKRQSKIMERARDLRYDLLSQYCRQHDISKLYVAHHIEDQAETILFRLAKGSGLDGLSAMQSWQTYNEDLSICRPLLSVSKERLIDTCRAHDIRYVTDPTNKNMDFARVRLRQSADILAKEGLSAKRLAVTAARLARGREALDTFADRVYSAAVIHASEDEQEDEKGIDLSFQGLAEEPLEIRLRVLQKAMTSLRRRYDMPSSYGPRMERLESLLDRIFNDSGFVSATLGGFLFGLDRKRGVITIKPEGI